MVSATNTGLEFFVMVVACSERIMACVSGRDFVHLFLRRQVVSVTRKSSVLVYSL